MTIMPRHLIQTLEYECSRCGWMWIGRRNGREKYTKGQQPRFCPKCKTYLWDVKRPITLRELHGQAPRLNIARKWYQRQSAETWRY